MKNLGTMSQILYLNVSKETGLNGKPSFKYYMDTTGRNVVKFECAKMAEQCAKKYKGQVVEIG